MRSDTSALRILSLLLLTSSTLALAYGPRPPHLHRRVASVEALLEESSQQNLQPVVHIYVRHLKEAKRSRDNGEHLAAGKREAFPGGEHSFGKTVVKEIAKEVVKSSTPYKVVKKVTEPFKKKKPVEYSRPMPEINWGAGSH